VPVHAILTAACLPVSYRLSPGCCTASLLGVVLPAESPQWRRGPPAKPILCNACGTRYRRTHHLGPPIPSTGRVGGPRPPAAGSSGRGSNGSGGGSTPGRKRVAAAEALGPAPLPVNLEGGVHTGTRLARNPHIRPSLKHYRSEDYEM
jgi:hypothetical protein